MWFKFPSSGAMPERLPHPMSSQRDPVQTLSDAPKVLVAAHVEVRLSITFHFSVPVHLSLAEVAGQRSSTIVQPHALVKHTSTTSLLFTGSSCKCAYWSKLVDRHNEIPCRLNVRWLVIIWQETSAETWNYQIPYSPGDAGSFSMTQKPMQRVTGQS